MIVAKGFGMHQTVITQGFGMLGVVPSGRISEVFTRERDELLLLQHYKTQKGYTDMQLATDMSSFGWTWTESYVAAILAGKARLGEEERNFIRRYLLMRYGGETLV